MKIIHKIKDDTAFGLVEIAVSLIVIGLILSSVINTVYLLNTRYKQNLDNVRIHKIQEALRAYYLRHKFLPCPAEISLENVGEAQKSCFGEKSVGPLPFKSLGLSPNEIVNGFGHLYTYGVGEAFTQKFRPHCEKETTSSLKVVDEEEKALTAPANPVLYIIVNHGQKGGGSFLKLGHNTHRSVYDPLEYVNATSSPVFRDGRHGKIDHKVVFETRDVFFKDIKRPCETPK